MNSSVPTYFVIGKNGQVAKSFAGLNLENMFFSERNALDLARPTTLKSQLDLVWKNRPFQILINTAAYTQVDMAETERDLAMQVNGESVGLIAEWCNGKNILLIHYSTDYVFSGAGDKPWSETNTPDPVNHYGVTKLLGEKQIQDLKMPALILRTSWIFSPYGINFVLKMLKLKLPKLKIINDQIGSPTYAPHLAGMTLTLAQKYWESFLQNKKWPGQTEIFNVTNTGLVSWHGFAEEIFKRAFSMKLISEVPDISAVPSTEYPTPAARPKNSRLTSTKLNQFSGTVMPAWQDGLNECLSILKRRGE